MPRSLPFLVSCSLAACLLGGLAASPAQARLGDRVGPARDFAKAQGARALELHPGAPPWGIGEPLVLAETWQAPAAGWSREEANAIIKALVNNRRRLLLKTSREGDGWTFTLRFEDEVAATCRFIDGRVRELHVRTPAFERAGATAARALRYEFPPQPDAAQPPAPGHHRP
ncbi:MAG: hypothetical protein VKS61_14010 [Candidatus Sericytochromatia bacterium]|nr:hypothetical protein [Candidatus Sericytochromatia bacterium]